MTWDTEHGPEYDAPPEILGLEVIEDDSWHNDVCPRFSLAGAYRDLIPEDVWLSIWVDHPDPSEREMTARYCVQVSEPNDPKRLVLNHFEQITGRPSDNDVAVDFDTDDVHEAIVTFTAWFRVLRTMEKEMV